MSPRLEELRAAVQRRAGRLEALAAQRQDAREGLERLQGRRADLARAVEVIQVVAKLTQQELEIHVSELTTLALAAVFPVPYRLSLHFELRRNRSEADLLLVDGDGNAVSPMEAVGGGVVDVTSLSLRVSLYSLRHPRPRNSILMDEPCRFVSRDLQGRASEMIREVSGRLGVQFLIVTHEETLAEAADKVFRVSKTKGVSNVEEVK